jgi:hypothetical protein
MKKKSIIFLIVVFCFTAAEVSFAGQTEENEILTAADNLFVQMKNKDYKAIWESLTFKTKEIIISDVYKTSKKENIELKKEYLARDFSSNGPQAQAYWNSYLRVFDPVIVLEQCIWEMGEIGKKEAEVILKYKKSDKPAILKMYKENNEWKVGLEESFGTRKINSF